MNAEGKASLKVLSDAIQMEKDGKAFYLKASELSQNDAGKELYKSLASEEDDHRKKIEGIYDALRKKKEWSQVNVKLAKVNGTAGIFKAELDKIEWNYDAAESEVKAVEEAIRMENKSYDYYQENAKEAKFAAAVELYTALAAEESAHKLALLDYFEYLKDPSAWFVKQERHLLDGA